MSEYRIPTLKLRPATGRLVRHKDGRAFAADGEAVPASSYYLRLLDAGDLERVPSKRRAPSKTTSKTPASKTQPDSGAKE